MKKKSTMIIFAILMTALIFCSYGCKKKTTVQQPVTEVALEETTTAEEIVIESEISDDEMSMTFGDGADQQLILEEDTRSDFERDLDSSYDEDYVPAEEEIDFSVFEDLDFEESSSIFTVTSLENSLNNEDEVLTVYTKAIGKLSGMPGTYTLYVPFTLNWKRGDRAHVSYKTCYYEDEEEGESLIISDLVFIEKTDDKEVSRAKQLATEREENARRESEVAAELARIEESKKAAEAEIAAQKAEVEKIRRAAAITYEQQQAAIVESIKAKEAAAAAGMIPGF